MSAFVRAAARLHADANLGISGIYRRQVGGADIPVSMILGRPAEESASLGESGTAATQAYAHILAADLAPHEAARNDTLIAGGVTYTVEGVAPDETGAVLVLSLSEP